MHLHAQKPKFDRAKRCGVGYGLEEDKKKHEKKTQKEKKRQQNPSSLSLRNDNDFFLFYCPKECARACERHAYCKGRGGQGGWGGKKTQTGRRKKKKKFLKPSLSLSSLSPSLLSPCIFFSS